MYSQTFSKAYRHETSSLGYNANILLLHNVTGRNPAVDIKAKSIKLNMAACDSVYRFPASNHQRLSLILLSPSSINASPTYQLSTHSFGKTQCSVLWCRQRMYYQREWVKVRESLCEFVLQLRDCYFHKFGRNGYNKTKQKEGQTYVSKRHMAYSRKVTIIYYSHGK